MSFRSTPRLLFAFVSLALVVSCSKRDSPSEPHAEEHRWSFEENGVTFDASFPRARISDCALGDRGKYDVAIRPENTPINDSPWFAFKVSAARPTPIVVHLHCEGGTLRYRPKISTDGEQWVMLPAECYEQATQGKEAMLRLEVGPEPLWVAAQELVSTAEMLSWAQTVARLPYVSVSEFGSSVSGQKLCRLDIGSPDMPRHVVVIGRQHPPETTGSLALMRFIEEIAGDSDMARMFRKEFHVMVLPLLNPDGVDAGHWRHNLGHVDLNRDWGAFAQPETRAASEQIIALTQKGRLYLHLDFHSTFNDVFYTQTDDMPNSPATFTARWLEGLQKRVPDYHVNREASSNPKHPTASANWAHKTFGIPGITYEIGDNTDRAMLKRVAAAAAQEMMSLMLGMKDEPAAAQPKVT
jgi:predicted deacylase